MTPDAANPGNVPFSPLLSGEQQGGLMVTGQGSLPAPLQAWRTGQTSGPEILNNSFDPIWLMHSFRRRWILATGLGLLGALIAGGVMLLLLPPKSEAVALLKVSSVTPVIAFEQIGGKEVDFDTFRQTQLAYLTSYFVINSALRKPGVSQLPSIRAAEPEPAAWLQEELDVSFPRDGEIMRIALRCSSAQEAKQLVDAVTDAYLDDVVFGEERDRREVVNLLRNVYTDTMQEIEDTRSDFQTTARVLGSSESDYASVDKELQFSHLGTLRKERSLLMSELLNNQLMLNIIKSSNNNDAYVDAAVSGQLEADPNAMFLKQQLFTIDAKIAHERTVARRPNAPSIRRYLDQRGRFAQELARVQGETRQRVEHALANSPNMEYKQAIKAYRIKSKHFKARIKDLDGEFEVVSKKIRKLAEQNLELESQQARLNQLVYVAGELGSKLETFEIELQAKKRVTPVQKATSTPGFVLQRYILTGMGTVFGFCFTAFAISYWDFRSRRLNNSNQMDDGLGIRVVGALPSLAFRRESDEADPVLAMLMESIDSVRTTLMHASTSKETRVVMITSAMGKEGRSTIASQLAASLARAGRRTLLLDGDLRHPSLHHLFDFPLDDGFCEVLRAEADVADVVRPTHAEGLWLMTAGYCDTNAIQALAKDQVQSIFDKLRVDYDFIIIDAAPVLTLSDSMIMGQYVDGVILSVMRDVSQVPKIHAASELLRSVGIRILGSVVNGVREKPDDRVARLRLPAVASAKSASTEAESTDTESTEIE